MEKYPVMSPLFRFKEDRIHMLIKETLQKKPVNSEFYSQVKQTKSQKVVKVYDRENAILGMDPKEFLISVGFEKGRLIDNGWGLNGNQEKKQRIFAPGPTFGNVLELDENEDEEFSEEKSKIKAKFKKIPLQIAQSLRYSTSPGRAETSKGTGRMTISQVKAREYLCFLGNLNKKEKTYIKTQITKKQIEIKERVEQQAKKIQSSLNKKGIFNNEVNKLRVESMIPVKIDSRVKITIDPMAKSAKDLALREKAKKWIDERVETQSERSSLVKINTKEKALESIRSIITKQDFKVVKDKNKKVQGNEVKRANWIERINKTVDDVMKKTKLDERMQRTLNL